MAQHYRRALVGAAIGFVAFVPAFLVVLLETGFGHGTYFYPRLLFPYWILLASARGQLVASTSPSTETMLGMVWLIVTTLQFPIYGYVIGRSLTPGGKRWPSLALLLVHVVATASSFYVDGGMPW